MADNKAEQILDTVVTTLTSLTTTGANIFRARAYPLQESNLPGLLLTRGSNIPYQQGVQNIAYIDYVLELIVTAVVRGTSNVDQNLSLIEKEVVVAMMADTTLGLSFVHDIEEGGSTEPETSSDGNQPVAVMATRFFVKYRRSRTDPSA